MTPRSWPSVGFMSLVETASGGTGPLSLARPEKVSISSPSMVVATSYWKTDSKGVSTCG